MSLFRKSELLIIASQRRYRVWKIGSRRQLDLQSLANPLFESAEIEEVSDWLSQADQLKSRRRILLGPSLVQCHLFRLTNAELSHSEQLAWAKHQLNTIYGKASAGWDLSVSMLPEQSTLLLGCCLQSSVSEILKPDSMVPELIACYQQSENKTSNWSIAVDDYSVQTLYVQLGNVHSIRQWPKFNQFQPKHFAALHALLEGLDEATIQAPYFMTSTTEVGCHES